MTETDHFTILIADRNPHVREFLRRELVADGFRVLLAKDGREVLKLLDVNERPDLLILDLEIPHVSGLDILKQLQERESLLPVVVHTFLTDYANHPAVQKAAAFVEKTGNNIDNLRAVILGVLQNWYPERKWEQNVKELKSTVFDPKSRHSVPYRRRG
jgi:DNA-binding response OmpR family regulator